MNLFIISCHTWRKMFNTRMWSNFFYLNLQQELEWTFFQTLRAFVNVTERTKTYKCKTENKNNNYLRYHSKNFVVVVQIIYSNKQREFYKWRIIIIRMKNIKKNYSFEN